MIAGFHEVHPSASFTDELSEVQRGQEPRVKHTERMAH